MSIELSAAPTIPRELAVEPPTIAPLAWHVKRLAVVTSVIHYRHLDRLWAYGPYVRELEVWADIFPQLVLAAPCRNEKPPADCLPIQRKNVSIQPVVETGGKTWWSKLVQVLLLPFLVLGVCRTMAQCDAIHVRCPGNLGLLGALLGPLFSRRLVAKYAGQWNSFSGEPFTYWLQRTVLGSWWFGSPVTVYGTWPNQPNHVITFFSTAFTNQQLEQAKQAAHDKHFASPPRILFVGRLSQAKHVDTLLKAVGSLVSENNAVKCRVVGTGPERANLEALTKELKIDHLVEFTGGVEFNDVLQHYEASDILVLASETEGFPKAILEGMAFGLFCIGSNRGFVPTMLAGRGYTVSPGSVEELADALRKVVTNREAHEQLATDGARWAQGYSLEFLGESLQKILAQHWKLASVSKPTAAASPVRLLNDVPETVVAKSPLVSAPVAKDEVLATQHQRSRQPVSIALVIDQLVRGGAEKTLVALANAIDPQRYRVHVICTRQPGDLREDLASHINFHALERTSRWDFSGFAKFNELLRREGIVLAHTHSHSSSYFARVARWLNRGQWQHVVHDHYGPIDSSPELKRYDRWLLANIDYYFGVAEHLRQYAQEEIKLPRHRCEYLLNGVELPRLSNRERGDAFTVVQVGRINATKNQMLSLEVAALLRNKVPKLKWIFIGPPDLNDYQHYEQCKREVSVRGLQDIVTFAGEQGNVAHYLAQADVGVLTSRYEGLSIALLEYMAHALPVVVTDVGACRDVVGPAEPRQIVPSAQAVPFAKILEELALNPAWAAECGQKNRTRVETNYSVSSMAQRVMAVYDRLLLVDARE